jgi:hypothetical protein
MQLRNLRVFVEVVRQGGFTEAARVLFSTQSTVSKAIRAGRRTGAGPAGARIAPHRPHRRGRDRAEARAAEMLGIGEDILNEVAELKGLQRGTCGWACRAWEAMRCSRRFLRGFARSIRA